VPPLFIASPRANLHKAVAKVAPETGGAQPVRNLCENRGGGYALCGDASDGLFCTNRQVGKGTEDEGDIEAAWALAKIGMAYRDAAYEAGRPRVDQVTLDLVSKPVSEMYTRQNRMDLETVTVSPAGLQMLREFKKATITARTKSADKEEAAVPNEFGDNGGSSEQPLSKRAKQRAAALKRIGKSIRDNTNLPKEPQAPPPIRQAAESRLGESNLPLKAAGANMVWPKEGRWEVGRVGSRRARDSSVELWGERSARSRSSTISFT
jgi:hypothetical protein